MLVEHGIHYAFSALLTLKISREYNLPIKFRMSNSFLILSGKWVTQCARSIIEGQRLQPHKLRSIWGNVMSEDDTPLPVTLRKKLERRRGRHITTYWADKTEWEAFCHWSRQSLSMAKLARGYDKFHLQSVQGASVGGKQRFRSTSYETPTTSYQLPHRCHTHWKPH